MPVHFYDEPFQMNGPGLDLLESAQNPLTQSIAPSARDLSLRTIERLVEALLIERLQQIIQRINFKRTDGVLIICRHENDGGYSVRRQRFENGEAIDARHFHIQKY